jgi:type IV secretory pathway TraG/TraD family ATPase VirD4
MGNGSVNRRPLSLGRFAATGQEYLFAGNESLITIARPGRGKSQGHVIRNLFYLDAPAIVLDVKPEIYDAVGAYRTAHYGPAIVFHPAAGAAHSASFNPLDAIPADPVEAFARIGQLVQLLMVPTDAKGAKGFWEGRAAQMLQAAIYDVCMNSSGQRDMTSVVEWFSQTPKQLAETIGRLQGSPIRVLARTGRQIEAMDPETQANVFDTVLRHVDVWGSPQMEPLVKTTSFDLEAFRRRNQTLYLCVKPEELVLYRPVLRALLGQVFFHMRDDQAGWDMAPVTFFLDEFPQLGYMPEIEQMLALGRQTGLRLWLFAQTKGQIALAYGDVNRIMDMMAVRCFIEPTGEMAQELSRELGMVRDPYTGLEKPLATPQQLSGPEYVGKAVVLEGGKAPARLDLVFAATDPAIQQATNGPRLIR